MPGFFQHITASGDIEIHIEVWATPNNSGTISTQITLGSGCMSSYKVPFDPHFRTNEWPASTQANNLQNFVGASADYYIEFDYYTESSNIIGITHT